MRKINENGRSMVEMLGVLAIIGVLSAGGLAGYSKAMFKHKLNTTLDQMTMLITNIRTMYGTQDNYNGLATDVIKLGIIPATMGTSVSALSNPFKGKVSIATGEAKQGEADTAFLIKYEGLPAEACVAIATSDWGAGAGSGFIGVDADSSTGADASSKYVGAGEGQSLSVTTAINDCGTANTSSVSLKFY